MIKNRKLRNALKIIVIGGKKNFTNKLLSIKNTKLNEIKLITAKETGKNFFTSILSIISFEDSSLANVLISRNSELAAAETGKGIFDKELSALLLTGYIPSTEFETTNKQIVKKTYKKNDIKNKNQIIQFTSYENLNKVSGKAPSNGGHYSFIVYDEIINAGDVKKNRASGKIISNEDFEMNVSIINSSKDRALTNARTLINNLKKRKEWLKQNRKCEHKKSRVGCYNFHNTKKTVYEEKICKLKKTEIKEITIKLNNTKSEDIKTTNIHLGNPWNYEFSTVKEVFEKVGYERYVKYIFPKCFPYFDLMKKYKNFKDRNDVIEEIEELWNKNEKRIIEHLKTHTHLIKYDKVKKDLMVVGTVFSNPTYFLDSEKDKLERRLIQIKEAVIKYNTSELASTLGIPTINTDERGLTYNTAKWKFNDFDKLMLLANEDKIVNISFGVDWDMNARCVITPVVTYNHITLNGKVKRKFIVGNQFAAIPPNNKAVISAAEDTYKKIISFVSDCGALNKGIKKYVTFDINAGAAFNIFVKRLFEEFKTYEGWEVNVVAAVIGDMFTSKTGTGYGIKSRQELVSNCSDLGFLEYNDTKENKELIETFKKIPYNKSSKKRIEKSEINKTGYNWERMMDTLNSFELAIWIFRGQLMNMLRTEGK